MIVVLMALILSTAAELTTSEQEPRTSASEAQASCERSFAENKCAEKIKNDTAGNREHYLDCSQQSSFLKKGFRCVAGGVEGAVDLMEGVLLAPFSPALLVKSMVDSETACSADRARKEEIAHIIKPLSDPQTYEITLQKLGCSHLGQYVVETVRKHNGLIAQKQAMQVRYETFIKSSEDSRRFERAERLFPKNQRELTNGEKEFSELYRKYAEQPGDFQRIYEKLRQQYKCASTEYLVQKACGAVTMVAGSYFAGAKAAKILKDAPHGKALPPPRFDPRLLDEARGQYSFKKTEGQILVRDSEGKMVGGLHYEYSPSAKTIDISLVDMHNPGKGAYRAAFSEMLREHPDVKVIKGELGLDNKTIADEYIKKGYSCRKALMETPSYKVRNRFGCGKITRAICSGYAYTLDVEC